MKKIKFNHLRMLADEINGQYSLEILVASGHADFGLQFEIREIDFQILSQDEERAAFLHAALHHPSQLKETRLNKAEVRRYLRIILHGKKSEVESFLTGLDNGRANGAISNMIRITCKREQSAMQQGHWFIE